VNHGALVAKWFDKAGRRCRRAAAGGVMSSALKLERPLLVFDLETTGVDVNNDRIVSMAVHWAPDFLRDVMFNPGRPIQAEATAVHGICDTDVRPGADVRRDGADGLRLV
jgi:DNA polymerase III epsilon subunit-like protein